MRFGEKAAPKEKNTPEKFLNIEITGMYYVGKLLGEKIDSNYPFFRYLILKEELRKDPEYKKQNKSGGNISRGTFK